MNTRKIVELESLLSEALQSIRIRRGQSEQLSTPQFRHLLQKCRDVYDPSCRFLLSSCKLTINETSVRSRALGFVERELANHIRDGKIHSATIAFSGGPSSGSPIEDVLTNVLKRAIVDGPRVAARAFANCTTNSSCSFYTFFLITGLSIPAAYEVFDGITLMPLPDSASALPPHLPLVPSEPDPLRSISINDLPGRTLVRVEYEASPIFHRPAANYTFESPPGNHFTIRLKGQEIPDPNLITLCQALAVVGRCRVESIMSWTSLLDYEIFDLGNIPGVGANGYNSTIPSVGLSDPVQLSPPQMDTIKTLYVGLTQLPSETWEKLRIPIDRWAKAMAEDNPIDQIIDLGISLESLYVPDAQGEVNFRFALHAAWHQGKDKEERQSLWEEFRQIYAARSDVVHTGRLRGARARSSFDVPQFVSRAKELCWRGITSVIEEGEISDWNNLIMGEELE